MVEHIRQTILVESYKILEAHFGVLFSSISKIFGDDILSEILRLEGILDEIVVEREGALNDKRIQLIGEFRKDLESIDSFFQEHSLNVQ